MRQAWGDFLRVAKPRAHGVQVYAEPEDLAESVVAFLAAGFRQGEPALLVAAPEHLPLFADGLAAAGWDAGSAQERGLLAVAGAEETLASFMVGDEPSPARFERAVGGLLDAVALPRRTVRVFGEMVDLLVQRGEGGAAVAVERLWNDLAETRDFSLLCGYRLDVFDGAVQAGTLPHICSSHSHVLPARNYPRFARAVDEALREVLGASEAASIYVRVSREAARGESSHVPLAQLLLMWVTENMPRHAARVLDTTRLRYATAA